MYTQIEERERDRERERERERQRERDRERDRDRERQREIQRFTLISQVQATLAGYPPAGWAGDDIVYL